MQFKPIEKRLSAPGAQIDRYEATDADRELVRKHVARSVDVDSLGIYQVVASSTRADMEGHVMSKAILDQLAKDYSEGHTIVMGSHNRTQGVGKSFDAEVVPDGDHHKLLVKFYVSPTMKGPGGSPAKDLIDTGVYSRSSIMVFFTEKPELEAAKQAGRDVVIFKSPKYMKTIHLAIVDVGMNEDAVMKAASPQSVLGDENKLRSKSNEMDKIAYSILALEMTGEVELKADTIDALFEGVQKKAFELKQKTAKLEAETIDLKKQLKAYQEAEESELTKLKDEYQNLSKQLDPDAKAETLEKKANLYTLESRDLLEEEIKGMRKQVAAAKQGITPSAGKVDEQKATRSHLLG